MFPPDGSSSHKPQTEQASVAVDYTETENPW